MESIIILFAVAALAATIFERMTKGSNDDIRPKYRGAPIELNQRSPEPAPTLPSDAVNEFGEGAGEGDEEAQASPLAAFSDPGVDVEGMQGDEGIGSSDENIDTEIMSEPAAAIETRSQQKKNMIERLVEPETIRAAVILNEVVGRPRAIQPWAPHLPNRPH